MSEGGDGDGRRRRKTSLGDIGAALFCTFATLSVIFGVMEVFVGMEIVEMVVIWDFMWLYVEFVNVLSLFMWVIYVLSLVEWLIAMGLAWEYVEVIKRLVWKGLIFGMILCYVFGIVVCMFYLFYNVLVLNSVVVM